jgi:hypothetical protein
MDMKSQPYALYQNQRANGKKAREFNIVNARKLHLTDSVRIRGRERNLNGKEKSTTGNFHQNT